MSYLSAIARLCWRNLTRLLLALFAVALLTMLMVLALAYLRSITPRMRA